MECSICGIQIGMKYAELSGNSQGVSFPNQEDNTKWVCGNCYLEQWKKIEDEVKEIIRKESAKLLAEWEKHNGTE